MPNPEKVRLVNSELARLTTVQHALKDNIDICHKGGAPPGPRFVSPLRSWDMISGDQADAENHQILEEMERLEEFKHDLMAGVLFPDESIDIHGLPRGVMPRGYIATEYPHYRTPSRE